MGRTILHKYWPHKYSRPFFYHFAVAVFTGLGLLSLVACQPGTPPAATASQALETIPAAPLTTADPATATTAPATPQPASETSALAEPVISPTAEPTSSPAPAAYPVGFWQELPVLPETISERAREIYRKGIAMGNNPHIFTKLGDCNSKSPDFLHGFGGMYDLGEFAYLQPAIDYWKDSFRLPNQATNPGTTTSRPSSSRSRIVRGADSPSASTPRSPAHNAPDDLGAPPPAPPPRARDAPARIPRSAPRAPGKRRRRAPC